MERSRKIMIVVAIAVGMGLFGYYQYMLASQISVVVAESTLLEEKGNDATYGAQLEFVNPSLLVLSTGETQFTVIINDEVIGYGMVEPFVLPAMNATTADATFTFETDSDLDEDAPEVQISGTTKYELFSAPVDIPFVYKPTAEQAMEFIRMTSR